MPKLKTRSAVKKRVKVSGGKQKRAFLAKSCKKHRLHQKSKSQKHFLRKWTRLAISSTLMNKVRKMLPGSF